MKRLTILLFVAALVTLVVSANADCARPELAQQSRDEATIRRLETAWTSAFLTGDTEFESCLLTPDFTEIMKNGRIDHLSDELAMAAKNKGKAAQQPTMPPITVLVHDDVAVAYGISSKEMVEGKLQASYYADYYVWKAGAWHAYFAQQTAFTP